MLRNFFLPVLIIFLFVNSTTACGCLFTPWFSLPTYDQSTFVVEIEVLEVLEFPEGKLEQHTLQVDSLDALHAALPPPTPDMRRDYVDFSIKIITDFKGSANGITLLRATNKSTSCYGGPEVGLRYLVYANGLETREGFQALVISDACQRKFSAVDPRFAKEKEILQQLAAAKDGPFVIKHPRNENGAALSGKFKNGHRHGKWIAYDPDAEQEPQEIVKLRYRKGKEVRRKYNEDFNSPFAEYYRRAWGRTKSKN